MLARRHTDFHVSYIAIINFSSFASLACSKPRLDPVLSKQTHNMPRLSFLIAFCFSVLGVSVSEFHNSGTPNYISKSFDCNVRKAAYEYGKALIPRRGDFKTLFDALQLGNGCNVPEPKGPVDAWSPTKYPTPKSNVIYADAAKGSDRTGSGSKSNPFQSIAKAVFAAKHHTTILLRGGTYFTEQIELGTELSGLTIQNYDGERVTVSGGIPINITGQRLWKPYKVKHGWDSPALGGNNIYGKVPAPKTNTSLVKYLGSFPTLAACQEAARADFGSVTWHHPDFDRSWASQCYGTLQRSGWWNPFREEGVDSVQFLRQNIWVVDLKEADKLANSRLGSDDSSFKGLRTPDGRRAIRAKFPNGDPELSGQWYESSDPGMGAGEYVTGWVTQDTEWLKPDRKPDATELVANGKDWPGVFWPDAEEGGSKWTGEGDWGDFHIGMGGYCDDIFPPTGYWCSMKPPRGQCFDNKTMTSKGCTQTHMAPIGIRYSGVLDRVENYTNPQGAIVQVWRGGGRWFTNLCRVSRVDKASKIIVFSKDGPGGGCNQGGEGEVSGSQWWIENVLEELDEAGEWYFDKKTRLLYYGFNHTNTPPISTNWVATKTEVLFNVTGTSQSLPVRGITIRGLELRDTSYTYIGTGKAAVHGMPSGGDWGLQRSGAILIENSEDVVVDGNFFTRIDGNGISLNNYNRRAVFSNNDFSWVGDSAMASWGSTGYCINANCSNKIDYPSGPDGRGGNQPRYTNVTGNLVREVGIWQKQSSMWFQATTARTYFARNVFFNGPRAALNFNDGFGGGDIIENNLLANCVRESGDHGPWNSWDRIPYITELGMLPDASSPTGYKDAEGYPSVVPTFRTIRYNFVFDVYSSQEGIDTDDVSSFYHTHDNFLVYAAAGLKSDFGGQWNWHYDNVYAYVGQCFGTGNNLAFFNNTCATFGDGYLSDCQKEMPKIYGNVVSNEKGEMHVCGGKSLKEWSKKVMMKAQQLASGRLMKHW